MGLFGKTQKKADSETSPAAARSGSREPAGVLTSIDGGSSVPSAVVPSTQFAQEPAGSSPPVPNLEETAEDEQPLARKKRSTSSRSTAAPPAKRAAASSSSRSATCTVPLPTTLLAARPDCNEAVEFIRAMKTPADQKVVAKLSREEVRKRACVAITQLAGIIANGVDPTFDSKVDDTIAGLRAEIEGLQSAAAEASTREGKLKEKVEGLQSRLSAADHRAIMAEKERDQEKEKFSQYVSAAAAERAKAVQVAFRSFPLSSEGRALLNRYREGSVEKYRNSTLFLEQLQPYMGFAVEWTLRLAQADLHAAGIDFTLDVESIRDRLPDDKAPECWKGDIEQPINEAYWDPVLQSLLAPYEAGCSDPAPLPLELIAVAGSGDLPEQTNVVNHFEQNQ